MTVLSLSEFLWSLLVIFFMMLFQVIIDVFRRQDESGVTKALWLIALLILPLFGLLIYMIVNSEGMAERNVSAVQQSQAAFDEHVRTVAGDGGAAAAEIAKANELRQSGAITEQEFAALKAKALQA